MEEEAASTYIQNFQDITSQINALCDKVEKIANAVSSSTTTTDIDDEQKQQLMFTVTSTFAHMRILNRQLHMGKLSLTSNVNQLKRKIDQLQLSLDNKRHEIAYVHREIDLTQRLETIYQTIDLIPEQEFMEVAPLEFKKDIDTPHKLMLSRLRFEIRQRETLVDDFANLREQRDELRRQKRKRIDKLEKLDSQLQAYVKTMALLGRSLGVSSLDNSDAKKDAVAVINENESESESKRARRETSQAPTPRV